MEEASMPRKRELIEPNEGDKRYTRRDAAGKFTEDQTEVRRSLAADKRSKSKTVVPKGQGDKGDQKRSKR
jgi:hypothetical protein